MTFFMHGHKKRASGHLSGRSSIQIETSGLFRLVPEDVLVHAFEMLDVGDMAVNENDVRQIIVAAGNLAVGMSDVEERGVVPKFLLDGVNGFAGFSRILELVQARRVAIVIVAHRAADAVRTAEIEFDRAFDDGANLVAGRIAPAVFKSRRGGAEEALPVARVVEEGVFPPPEFGFRPTIEERPAEHVAIVLAVHVRSKTDLF